MTPNPLYETDIEPVDQSDEILVGVLAAAFLVGFAVAGFLCLWLL
jgi:hypothetical protein